MVRWLIPFLLILSLPAHATGGGLTNDAAGLSGVYSAQVRISDHPHHVLMGHVIVVQHDGTVARAVVIGHRRDGVHRLRFNAAWAEGRRLPFRPQWGTGCSHGHCRDGPVGLILLDGAAFDRARRDGLAAHLTGPSGAIDIVVPAALFDEAATRAADR
jgi:hypothetical protein